MVGDYDGDHQCDIYISFAYSWTLVATPRHNSKLISKFSFSILLQGM